MTESGARRSPSRSASPWTPRRLVAIALAAIFVLLIVANRQPVTIELLLIDVTGPAWLMMIVTFGLGALVAWLWIARRRRS